MNRKRGTQPLHVTLQDTIRSLVHNEGIRPGEMIPSERELSKCCGASRSSVRKAILSLVQEGVLVRIPGKGTFVAENSGSASPFPGRTGNIGFVVLLSSLDRTRPDIQAHAAENGRVSWMPFYSEVFEGASQELQRNDLHLLFFVGYQDDPSERSKFRDFLKKVDGAIVCELAVTHFAQIIEAASISAVFLNPSVALRSEEADVVLM
ncbi:MAG: GntR family transcriptional regulator, partial [Atribacterota bacterium]|nr:GntR family transcriptional regulator [Atribacterota bacterium]